MSIKPRYFQGKLNSQTDDELVQRLLNKIQFSKRSQYDIKQLARLAKELEDDSFKADDISVSGKTPEDVRNARKWFSDQVHDVLKNPWSLSNLIPDKLKLRWYSRKEKPIGLPSAGDIGRMFFYGYNPKTKDTLPYYDIFPLIIMVKGLDDGWHGLNLHYLPPKHREILLLRLMENMTNTKVSSETRIRLNYALLSKSNKYRLFRPCFKRYLMSHTTSAVRPVPFVDWPKAILLPVAKFKKASITQVWADSLKITKGFK